jgi:hypothetical protein
LRLRNAFLARTSEVEAVLAVIRIMASTPNGSWAGCAHFGIRDFFEQARTHPELPQRAIDEANLALQDLGITQYRIESIVKERQADRDVDSYAVTLASADDIRRTAPLTA